MSKEPKVFWTFNLMKSEGLKANMPKHGYNLISYKKTWYGMYILKFEKRYING